MQTSSARVASIHIAKMKRVANFKKKVADLATDSFLVNANSEAKKIYNKLIPDKSKKGWAIVGKGFKASEVIKALNSGGQPFDLSDPIQKVVYSSIQGKSAVRQIEIVGLFSQALSEQDLDKMSKSISFDKDALALILLWYSRKQKVRGASLKDLDRAMATQPATYSRWIEVIPKKTIRLVEHFTGGSLIEWMLKIFPQTTFMAKPIKWGWWVGLYLQRKNAIYHTIKWSGVALSWLAKTLSMPSFFKTLAVFGGSFIKVMGASLSVPIVAITALLLLYIVLHGREGGFYEHLNRTNIALYFYGHMKYAWMILLAVIKGAISVPKYLYDEIKGWYRDIKRSKNKHLNRELGVKGSPTYMK